MLWGRTGYGDVKTISGQWLDVEIANGAADDFPPGRQPLPLREVVGREAKRRHITRGVRRPWG
jgi:hypothetical protein